MLVENIKEVMDILDINMGLLDFICYIDNNKKRIRQQNFYTCSYNDIEFLISYKTLVGFIKNGVCYCLGYYSATTSKQVTQYCNSKFVELRINLKAELSKVNKAGLTNYMCLKKSYRINKFSAIKELINNFTEVINSDKKYYSKLEKYNFSNEELEFLL